MPGIMGFPQLDPGYDFGGSPPAEEQEAPTKPAPMPLQPDPALEEYDSRQEERIKHLDTIRPIKPPDSGQGESHDHSGASDGTSIFTIAEQIRRRNRKRAEQDTVARNRGQSAIDIAQDIEWQNDTTVYDLTGFLQLAANADFAAPDPYESTPLTPGQAEQVDYLLTEETDSLAREMLITLKRDGIPPRREWNDFMAQYALFSWDSESDAQAWATLALIAESDWDETTAYADEDHVEAVAQDRANDWIEGLTVIHAGTGDILLDVTGVVLADGSQYVQMRMSGDLKLYESEEAVIRGDVKTALTHPSDRWDFVVWDQSATHPYAVKIGGIYWIDLRDPSAELVFSRVGPPPNYSLLRAKVSGQEYDNTSVYFLHSLKEVQRNPHAIGLITVPGILRLYSDEEFDRTADTPFLTVQSGDPLVTHAVLRYSELNPNAALIDIGGQQYWIDTSDPDANISVPSSDDTVATDTPSGYSIQSIVPGEETGKEDVEISYRVYADRTKGQLGWLTRDYNTRANTTFFVQTPVIGPDVRVELVIRAESNPESSLGNYVVISFPASVYLSNPALMHQLELQNLASQRLWNQSLAEEDPIKRAQMQRMARLTAHNPVRWQEDGRIIMAFAHLSEFGPYMVPGQIIDDADKSLIGETGNTGKGIEYHHLDLLEAYVGSSELGSGALESWMDWLRQKHVVEGSQDYEQFFKLAKESQLYPHGGSSLYIENIDTARSHPELDDTFRIAQYLYHKPDPKDSIYFEDE